MEAIIGLLIGLVLGAVLSHVYKDRAFTVHVKHESMVTGIPEDIDIDKLLGDNVQDPADSIYDAMGSVTASIEEIMNGGAK